MGRIFYVPPTQYEVENASQIRSGEIYAVEHAGQLPNDGFWHMLESRHSLNSVRFDHWHPNLGLILEHAEHDQPIACTPDSWEHMRGPHEICLTPPPSQTIPPPCIAVTPPPIHEGSQVVPEPSSVISLMVGVVLLAAWAVGRVK